MGERLLRTRVWSFGFTICCFEFEENGMEKWCAAERRRFCLLHAVGPFRYGCSIGTSGHSGITFSIMAFDREIK